jgi:hypothetical protein
MAGKVLELIRALNNGSMSIEEVAQRFRERTWPATNPPLPASYEEMAERALEDPRPDVTDSFDDVVAAYGRGEITRDQFLVLGEAVTESKRAKHQQP